MPRLQHVPTTSVVVELQDLSNRELAGSPLGQTRACQDSVQNLHRGLWRIFFHGSLRRLPTSVPDNEGSESSEGELSEAEIDTGISTTKLLYLHMPHMPDPAENPLAEVNEHTTPADFRHRMAVHMNVDTSTVTLSLPCGRQLHAARPLLTLMEGGLELFVGTQPRWQDRAAEWPSESPWDELHEFVHKLAERRASPSRRWGETAEFANIFDNFDRLLRGEPTRGPRNLKAEIVREILEILQKASAKRHATPEKTMRALERHFPP